MIRKMVTDDILNIVDLEHKVLNTSLGDKFLYNEVNFNPFAHYYVYEINNQIIAYLGTRVYDSNSEILNFAVDSDYQNKGYGQKLFDHVIKDFNKLGVKSTTLEVRVSNIQALNFYTKNKFKKAALRKKYYGNEDGFLLIKEL